MRCDDVAELLPGIVDGTRDADRRTVRHVASCLHCQAELAGYHRLLRRLHQLRTQRPELPPGLVGDVLAALESAVAERTVRSALAGRRLAAAVGAAAGAAALGTAVGVVAVWRGRTTASLGNSPAPGGNLSTRPCDRLAVRGMAIDRGQ